jgi:hypothetical protein
MKNEQWARWLEVVASAAIIVSLIVLIVEVRTNTAAVERQAAYERALTVSAPYFDDPDVAEAFAKILEVEGPLPLHQAYVDRYGLTVEQAIKWSRHHLLFWSSVEADMKAFGRSDDTDALVRQLVCLTDHAMFWDSEQINISAEFRDYIANVRRENSC